MKCFLKYFLFLIIFFFPQRWEEGPPEDCSICWNNAFINMNELLVNNFHFFLTNVQMLSDSGTGVCMCPSQHMLLK